MIRRLRQRAAEGKTITVGVIGAGAMGRGIALQVAQTPGMQVSWIADIDLGAAKKAAALASDCLAVTNARDALNNHKVDVMVEATNSIADAADYCLTAFAAGSHVVLMNAEVDLAVGVALKKEAEAHGVIVTSDAGDQHGVLATMIDEAELWGLRVVQAGNIKGFLNEDATPESIRGEAEKRNLSAGQCCAYTDGTKLHIEMAVLANAHGYHPPQGGMAGPRAAHVTEALEVFDFASYGDQARIDYLLGAKPGGGVYLVVECPEGTPDEQKFLLNYYKLGGGPYYLLYRPYHLCHLETVRAVAMAALDREPLLQPWAGRVCDVYAYAKADLAVGTSLSHAIGSAEVLGKIALCSEADAEGLVPISLLESPARIIAPLRKGEPLTVESVSLEQDELYSLWATQLP